jgi:hypothetical protein
MIWRAIELKKSILALVLLPLLIIAAVPTSIGLEYNHYFNTFSMKVSTPPGISAKIDWSDDSADPTDSVSGGSAILTDGQDVSGAVDFGIERFVREESRDSSPQNLVAIFKENLVAQDPATPTVFKLKNGDYIVSGFWGEKMFEIMRTFDFDHDGQVDCYFSFDGYRNEGVYQQLYIYLASSADVSPYSTANWNPYID